MAVFLVGGCAPKQTEPKTASDEHQQDAETVRKGEASLPPLVPVETPPGVVVRFRVKDPAMLVDGLAEAMSIPFDIHDLAVFEKDSVYFQAADLNASVEGAVVLNPVEPLKPFRFFSLGAKSVDAVLSALEKKAVVAEEGPGGVYHFKLEGEPCLVGRSMGNSAARVVCSDERESLRGLSDYALRGLPNETFSKAAVYFQADLRPIKKRYEKELQRVQLLASVGARQLHVGHPKLDRALTDASIGLAEELSALLVDTDTIVAELNEKKGDFFMTTEVGFSQERSTTVRTLREHEARQGPAPEIFRNLPAAATFAQYSQEISAERAEPWMSVLSDLASGYAEHKGTSPEFSKRLARFVRSWGPAGSTFVLANGPLVKETSGSRATLRNQWSFVGTTRKKDDVLESLDDLSWLLASSELAKLAPEGQFDPAEYVPTLKRVTNVRMGSAPGAVVYHWKLPQKVQSFVDEAPEPSEIPSAKEGLEEWMDGHVVVFEMNQVTWVTWSASHTPKQMDKTLAFLVQSKDQKTLADVGELKPLLREPALSAGFYKLEGLAGLLSTAFPPDLVDSWEGLLRATPGRGKIPTTFWSRIEKNGPKTKLVYRWDVPREFILDGSTLGTLIIAELGDLFD